MIRTIYRWMIKAIETICVISIFIIVILTGYEVVMRQMFSQPTIWTNELTSYLLVWFGLLGIVYAYDKKTHISVDMIYRCLPLRMRQAADILTSCLILMFAATILFYGYKYWWMAHSRGWEHVGMLDMPMSYTRFALPLVGFLMTFQLLIEIYDQFRGLTQGSGGNA